MNFASRLRILIKKTFAVIAKRRFLLLTTLVSLMWLYSLSLLPCSPIQTGLAFGNEVEMKTSTIPSASWSDSLIFNVNMTTSTPHQQTGAILWRQDGYQNFSHPFFVVADGRSHTITLPIGVYSSWRDSIDQVRFVFPYQDPSNVEVTNIRLVQRPWWALDQMLLRALFPVLPQMPPWSSVVLTTAFFLAACIAALSTHASVGKRLGITAIVFGGAVGIWSFTTSAFLATAVIPLYVGQSSTTVAARVPFYDTDHRATAQIADAASHLPEGSVLLLDPRPTSDLLHYARYVLYPRRVDVRNPQEQSPEQKNLIAKTYTAVIELQPTGQAPQKGWQKVAVPDGPLAIWRTAGSGSYTLPSPSLPAIFFGAGASLFAMMLIGWSLGSLFGLQGWLRLCAMWPLGTIIWAWWMWALNVVGVPWNWGTTALPLTICAVALVWRTRKAFALHSRLRPPQFRWSAIGGIGMLALFICVGIQAVLLPSMDRDSWTMWGLKAKAFYLDSAIAPVLTMYRQFEPHHASYPVAQPLVLAWLYQASGGFSERVGKSIFPLWYVSGVGLVWFACRRWLKPYQAMAWAFLLATTPIVLDHAAINNADLPLAVVLLLGGIVVIEWIDTGRRAPLVGAVIVLAGGAWLRPDGMFLGVGVLVAATTVRLSITARQQASIVPVLRNGACALAGIVLLIVPWLLHTSYLGLNSEVRQLAGEQVSIGARLWAGMWVILAEMLFSYSNSAQGLLGGSYGVLWLIGFGTVIFNWRRVRSDPITWFLLFIVLGGLLFYLLVYVVRPYFSIDRYLLHLAPLLVLAAARSMSPLPDAQPSPPKQLVSGRTTKQRRRKEQRT